MGTFIFWTSCNDDDSGTGADTPGKASVQFSLTDDPAEYDAVLIEVTGLEYRVAHDTGATEASEWVTVAIDPRVYNLLELNNGTEATLVDEEMDAGKLEEVRLILDEDNALVTGGDTTELTVPSGGTSGLKLKIETDLSAGERYKVVLDFDAAKSVVKAGNSGNYNPMSFS